jgi:hypothetical protein
MTITNILNNGIVTIVTLCVSAVPYPERTNFNVLIQDGVNTHLVSVHYRIFIEVFEVVHL